MPSIIWYKGHDLLVDNVVRADNCSLFDAAGREYVDLESGVWCTSVGHSNPRVLAAIAEQSGRVMHTGFSYSSAVVEEAAQEVLSLLGFRGGRCVFLSSGSEAVEYAVRAARAVSGKPALMVLSDSYCGAYGSVYEKRQEEWFAFDWTACESCVRPGLCSEGCSRWARVPLDRIGGFLLEPGSSSGFVRFPPERLIRAVATALRQAGGLLLANEVTTGMGRTGEWFGYQHYGVQPDVVVLGKGLGNGYPVSAVAFNARIADHLEEHPITYAQSHQNDPLGAAIAKTVIQVIRDQGLVARAKELGDRLRAGLERIGDRTGRIRESRGRGLMLALDLRDGVDDIAFAKDVHLEMVRRGFVLLLRPHTSTLRVDPPLTLEDEHVSRFLDELESVLADGPRSGSNERSASAAGNRARESTEGG